MKKRQVNVKWYVTEAEYLRLREAARSFGFERVDAYIREVVRMRLNWPGGPRYGRKQ